MLRDLRAPDGGFAAAEDADSEGEEGRFYLWSLDEVTALLGPAAAEEFAGAFHVKTNGNFTSEIGERSDRNILHRLSPLAIGAGDFTLRAGGLPPGLEASRTALLTAREKRVRPHRDDKVLADWNGLMIAALAKAAEVFGEPSYAREAAGAAEFVLTKLRDAQGNLLHRYRDGEAAFPAVIDDYADLAWGCLELARRDRRAALAGRGDGARRCDGRPLRRRRGRALLLRAGPAAAVAAGDRHRRRASGGRRRRRRGAPAPRERDGRGAVRGAGPRTSSAPSAAELERAPLGCCQLLSASMLL